MRKWYKVVMNDEVNPLRELPKPRRFQLMTVLSFMWTTIFCFALSTWLWFDEIMLAHMAVLLGTAMTGVTFQKANGGERAEIVVSTKSDHARRFSRQQD